MNKTYTAINRLYIYIFEFEKTGVYKPFSVQNASVLGALFLLSKT